MDLVRKEAAKAAAPADILRKVELWVKAGKDLQIQQLFSTNNGFQVVQKILTSLDGTRDNSSVERGWQDLAGYLGLPQEQIRALGLNRYGQEGPTFYTMALAIQHKKHFRDILDALVHLGRKDILQKIDEPLEAFFTEWDGNNSKYHQSDIGALDVLPLALASDLNLWLKSHSTVVQPIQCIEVAPPPVQVCRTALVCAAPTEVTTSSGPYKYDLVVMLTFAADGIEVAQKTAGFLRQKQNGKTVGVLLLEEQRQLVEENPTKAIHELFKMVDYILPIVTPDYVRNVRNRQIQSSNLDVNFANCIFQYMENEYISNSCRNKRVRPIVLDENGDTLCRHSFFRDPLFFICTKSSELPILKTNLLKQVP